MASTVHLEEGQISTCLNLPIVFTIVEFDILDRSLVEVLLTWPLKCFGPGLVTEPVADEICVTSIYKDYIGVSMVIFKVW